MVGKVVVSTLSVLLVVGVVIGVIVGIHSRSSSGSSNVQESPSMKAISSMCAHTDYKDVCSNSLEPVAQNASATPKDFIQAAVKATIDEVKAALEKSGSFANASDGSRDKMAVEDCKDLLQSAVAELQASFSSVGDAQMHALNDRADELKNWLSAVISYQQSCIDGFDKPEFQKSASDGLFNATRLTSNALALVSEISEILSAFNIPINMDLKASNSRRLLGGDIGMGENGFPTWMSAADRKLLAAGPQQVKPNAVVAKDGSGQYKTITAALQAYPKNNKGRYVIYVKAGVYDEEVMVDKNMVNVFMYGDGPRKTIVTGRKSYTSGFSTFKTASFSAVGNGFIAKAMGFSNTAGPEGHQAVALRVQSDMSALYNCRMDGYQDTLYTQAHRQFYRNCVISGTVDFIFGDAAAVIQNSLLIVRKPMDNQQNAVTAQGRSDRRETSGIVIHNCRIVPEQKLFPVRFKIPTYLGRPWKEFSRTVIMESTIGDFIQPAGWMAWDGDFALNTLFFAEYANRGPGARTDRRVKWRGYKVITNRNEAAQFTAGPFINGNLWLRTTSFPYQLGFRA
ncbi:pectinesterase [Malania oleifera]|uniref:pectinesterase n=1 Tax=Malania oleifera TaxID=397392 RepID=UPI0025ADBBEC|nr:pectinesterase [Malania oleifera]